MGEVPNDILKKGKISKIYNLIASFLGRNKVTSKQTWLN